MPEHTVHDHMQIISHRNLLGCFVALQNVFRIVENVLAVGQQRVRFDGEQFKLAERRIQKPQIDQQGVAREDQYILCQLI